MHASELLLLMGELACTGQLWMWFPPAQKESTGHATHTFPFSPYHPERQTQSVLLSLMTGEAELAGQVERLPWEHHASARHGVHGPPAGPSNPPLQMQSSG